MNLSLFKFDLACGQKLVSMEHSGELVAQLLRTSASNIATKRRSSGRNMFVLICFPTAAPHDSFQAELDDSQWESCTGTASKLRFLNTGSDSYGGNLVTSSLYGSTKVLPPCSRPRTVTTQEPVTARAFQHSTIDARGFV